jgi:acyl-CoA dehydrogenase
VIDFTIPHDLHELVQRVRAYVEEDVLPAEATTWDLHALDRSWQVVDHLRDRARQRGVYAPHLPREWGGLGVGVLGMALIAQECGGSALASLGLNAMAPDEGNMHTLLMAGRGSSWKPT